MIGFHGVALHSDDDDEYTHDRSFAAPSAHVATVVAAPENNAAPTPALPAFLAPGNGQVAVTSAGDGEVTLISGVTRIDLMDNSDGFKCAACGAVMSSLPLLEVHKSATCPKRR